MEPHSLTKKWCCGNCTLCETSKGNCHVWAYMWNRLLLSTETCKIRIIIRKNEECGQNESNDDTFVKEVFYCVRISLEKTKNRAKNGSKINTDGP